jgi:transcriptional regulator with XRE-family HTH domain
MVRWTRKRAGMTQYDLARAVGIAQSSVARIETGAVIPLASTLLALLDAAGQELAVDRRIGRGVDRGPIRELLRQPVPRRTRRAMKAARMRGDPTKLLRALRRHGVRFILIGAWAEMAHGAPGALPPIIEVGHAGDSLTLRRLALAKADTDDRRLVRRQVTDDEFGALWRNAVQLRLGAGLLVRVAAVDDLIRIRRASRRPEDADALETLGALRDELDALPH